MIRPQSRFVILGIFVAFFATACSDVNAPEGEPPTLPPATSLVMDFTDFPEQQLATASTAMAAPAAGSYWMRSAFVVGVWNAIVTITLAPPTLAFIASFGNEPEWDDEAGAWVWMYDFDVLTVPHSARLEARMITDNIQWDMYISREGGFTDFNWFSGVSHASGTSGTWALNKSPDDPTEFLDIEWSRASSGDTHDLKYTIVETGADGYGNYIEHGWTEATPYNAYYNLYNSNTQNLTEIQWNRTTKAGRTADDQHFGDPDWRCWDEDLENADCQ